MLHRLSLRILPQLSLAVTEPEARTRKRWVMFVVGFVAFAAYRVGKQFLPLHEGPALVLFAAAVATVVAAASYAAGRRLPLREVLGAETPRRWFWLLGWTGGVYGAQLALLVLALLQICVQYDFLQHPDGPAMMAVIISSSAVARDAVEIGHLRWLESQGRSFLTFPDGGSLRSGFLRDGKGLVGWGLVGMLLCAMGALLVQALSGAETWPLVQLLLATLLGGTTAVAAYLGGLSGSASWPAGWVERWRSSHWLELGKFWWWPGFAFAATYYLVAYGLVEFVLRQGAMTAAAQVGFAAIAGLLMGTYCYYLGARRAFEDRIQATVPSTLLRCPFITGILKKRGGEGPPDSLEVAAYPQASQSVAMKRIP